MLGNFWIDQREIKREKKQMGKKRKDSTSSSSSSEDDLISRQLKECVTGFELEKKEISKSKKYVENHFVLQCSKRPDKVMLVTEGDDENSHVTPEFQEFVGKKLRAKMDE